MHDIFDLTKFREDHKLELVGMNLFKSQNDPFVRYFYIEHQNKTEAEMCPETSTANSMCMHCTTFYMYVYFVLYVILRYN